MQNLPATGLKLPTNVDSFKGQFANGYATPTQDILPQLACFAPQKVIPIVFLPGIMGSNICITDSERIKRLGQEDNIAWRPDSIGVNVVELSNMDPATRQLRLDPKTSAVDIYNPKGPPQVSGDQRNSNVKLSSEYSSPMLAGSVLTPEQGKTSDQRARERGWGEVYFGSYGGLLQHLEYRMNNMFTPGGLDVAPPWRDVVDIDPKVWMADSSLPQQPLTADELKAVAKGHWFPVYAFGYNWLQSNGDSAVAIADRINAMMEKFNATGFNCQKVILVTHSMGGLLGRALIHPDYGNLGDKVLGIVHGVQPAIGAAAAYRRIRAGFEDPGLVSNAPLSSVVAKLAGNYGDEVTAVLANAPGGLELLPNKAYGNGWFRVVHRDKTLISLPIQGDPYQEIYKLKGKWYGLLREEWINPSGLSPKQGGGSIARTETYLDQAKKFHDSVVNTYHSNSYAHYGADPKQISFGSITWQISSHCVDPKGWENWPILYDTRQGKLELVRWISTESNPAFGKGGATTPLSIEGVILGPDEPGDQTVPMRSADHQMRSGKFKGIFRQTGYDHQSSYKDGRAIASTLYSIVRIAQAAR